MFAWRLLLYLPTAAAAGALPWLYRSHTVTLTHPITGRDTL